LGGVSRKLLLLLVVAALAPLLLAVTWDAGLFASRHPPLPETSEAIERGRRIYASRCRHCHQDVPLERRVAGWSAERAYHAIGRLPQLAPNMPPFRGTEEERRALAVFLSALGNGRATR
jgi:mono/diheme cytochrome c family protein